jgi:SAM-dependent methyltransferase
MTGSAIAAPSMTIAACRACGGSELVPVLSLGETPLANALLTQSMLGAAERKFPLDVVLCAACALLQITETVRPDILFADYPYMSSFSDSFVDAGRKLAAAVVVQDTLGCESLVVEVASNDGYLLQSYRALGVPVLGIDPAANVAAVAESRGVPTRVAFFGRVVADELVREGVKADVIHANNVLAHVPDLEGVITSMRRLLKPRGVAIIEVPYARELIERCEFDTIYHEHLCYFSMTPLAGLLARNGLVLADVEQLTFHGGSLRIFARHAGAEQSAAVVSLLEEERRIGMRSIGYYADFAARVRRIAATLRDVVTQMKRDGATIAAYGASAKGTTLLSYCGIGGDLLDFVVDRSTVKQGRYTPGTQLPIVSPTELLARRPDYLLMLSWNFAEEIIAQQSEYVARGGRFIIPIPEVRLV